jgi:hypothetical protein
MNSEQNESLLFFQDLGEIWRDITALEFLMRCAIAKYDGEESKFPKPPYEKGKSYKKYPKAFAHLSFEIVVEKFNNRFPEMIIAEEIVQLRDAMAHGITAEIDKSGKTQLVKFKEMKDSKELMVEFSIILESKRVAQLRHLLMELRRCVTKIINKKTF